MSELERALVAIGAELDYPPTPTLVATVRARVGAAPAPRRTLGPRRAITIAFAVLLIGAGGAFAASPGLRHSVLDWLGLRSVRIERAPRLPDTPPGATLALGTRTTLDGARRTVSFDVLAPALAPDQVYATDEPPGGQVALLYRPRPGLPDANHTSVGLLITEFRGDLPFEFLQKTLAPGTTAERLTVNGGRGVWIAGQPHVVLYRDSTGEVRDYTLRLATNTLIWRQGTRVVRLEAHISEAAALRIAGSMR
jgi:hypothetical protein